jgi:hypothetical protein
MPGNYTPEDSRCGGLTLSDDETTIRSQEASR